MAQRRVSAPRLRRARSPQEFDRSAGRPGAARRPRGIASRGRPGRAPSASPRDRGEPVPERGRSGAPEIAAGYYANRKALRMREEELEISLKVGCAGRTVRRG